MEEGRRGPPHEAVTKGESKRLSKGASHLLLPGLGCRMILGLGFSSPVHIPRGCARWSLTERRCQIGFSGGLLGTQRPCCG